MIVAVLGAGGTMGAAMARNIATAGHDVRAWNRTREKAEPLAADGVTVVDTPDQAADGAEVLVTMLSDGDAVLHATSAALGAARRPAVWVQVSTIGIEATERAAQLAQERGVAFVDAPVLGTKQPAEEGKLVVLASGPDDVRDRVQPLFDAVSQRTMWLGAAGQGSRLKLVANLWVVTVVEGAAETFALAEGLGLDPELFLDALEGGALDLPYLRMKAKAIAARDFTPNFRLALAAKDADLVAEAAERHGLHLALAEAIAAQMHAAADDGHGDEDLSATWYATGIEPHVEG